MRNRRVRGGGKCHWYNKIIVWRLNALAINAQWGPSCHCYYFVVRWARTVLTANRVHMSPALLNPHIFINYAITTPGDEQLTKHQTILDELYLAKSITLRHNYQPASMFVYINKHLSPDLSLYFKLSDPNHKALSECNNWSQP